MIKIRYAHQSEEEAKSVRISRAQSGSSDYQSIEGDPEQEENRLHPHRPPADATCDSQRQHLAKEINDIIKASAIVSIGESTGLNRRARWGEKLAAGSTIPARPMGTSSVTSVSPATGNTANAQLAARETAQGVSALYYNDNYYQCLTPFRL